MPEWCHKLDQVEPSGDSWWRVRIPGADAPETWCIPAGEIFCCPTCGARLSTVDDIPMVEEMVPRAALECVVAWLLQDRHCPPPWSPETCPYEGPDTGSGGCCATCIARAALAPLSGAGKEANGEC